MAAMLAVSMLGVAGRRHFVANYGVSGVPDPIRRLVASTDGGNYSLGGNLFYV